MEESANWKDIIKLKYQVEEGGWFTKIKGKPWGGSLERD